MFLRIERAALKSKILNELNRFPAVALLGPRQCGKTTIAREIAAECRPAITLDLEDPEDLAKLEAPKTFLSPLQGLVVIDEFQKKPSLLEILRVLCDRPGHQARFLILGSASPDLVRGSAESLAGRLSFIDMTGFTLPEIGAANWRDLWLRGGLPRSFLASSDAESSHIRAQFVRTFFERDIPALGITIPPAALMRFWNMVAHYHGVVWKASELARSLGTSEPTTRKYLDLLTGAYVVRQLQPWHESIAKRQVKSPKVYLRDSGLLHAVLKLQNREDLAGHPKFGASWEGFVLEQILGILNERDAYFWATHAGAELDLMIIRHGKRYGFEMKCADAPAMTKSLQSAIDSLGLEHAWIVYPGDSAWRVHERVQTLPIGHLVEALRSLDGA